MPDKKLLYLHHMMKKLTKLTKRTLSMLMAETRKLGIESTELDSVLQYDDAHYMSREELVCNPTCTIGGKPVIILDRCTIHVEQSDHEIILPEIQVPDNTTVVVFNSVFKCPFSCSMGKDSSIYFVSCEIGGNLMVSSLAGIEFESRLRILSSSVYGVHCRYLASVIVGDCTICTVSSLLDIQRVIIEKVKAPNIRISYTNDTLAVSSSSIDRLNIANSILTDPITFETTSVGLLLVDDSIVNFMIDRTTFRIVKLVNSLLQGDTVKATDLLSNTLSHGKIEQNQFVMYKKVRLRAKKRLSGCIIGICNVFVKLLVPAHAERHYDAYHGKIRVSEAKVLEVIPDPSDLESRKCPTRSTLLTEVTVHSSYDPSFVYKVGKTVRPVKPFDKNNVECASGIHGFLTMDEAVKYVY